MKYHLGYSSDIETPGGTVHLTLSFNPSHLEIISPVVEGSVRARQERRKDSARDQVLPILIHGDAAFSGQGVVMETFNLSQTRGYTTGGTVHIIINNQIGFTTNYLDGRSSTYCTDVGKVTLSPVMHVNADDVDPSIMGLLRQRDFLVRAMEAAQQSNSLTPMGSMAKNLYTMMQHQGAGSDDFSAIFKLFSK